MKQRRCGNQPKFSLLSEFSPGESEVARILLELPVLFGESECGSKFPFSWGAKKRRSAEENSVLRRLISPPPPPPVVGSAFEPEKAAIKVEACSPATPLSFSPSESDETPKRLKIKASPRKPKEELLLMIEQCSRSNEFLRNEIQRVWNCCRQLQATNLSLKALKQELSLGLKRDIPDSEAIKSLNLEMNLGQATAALSRVGDGRDCHHHHQQQMLSSSSGSNPVSQQPLTTDQMVANGDFPHPHCQTLPLFPASGGLRLINDKVGPLGLPDLNASLEEALWMDGLDSKSLIKAMAARARKERMKICKRKNSNTSKSRMPMPSR